MKIHEYQAKELLRAHGVPVPAGKACFSAAEATAAASELGGEVWVVKAQIHAGGRGKGGGVQVCKSMDEVKEAAERIFGMQLVTHQTGPEGQQVRRLLVEQGAAIERELYLGMVVDRQRQQVVVMASAEGGMEIEEVAAKTPEKILKAWVDPAKGVDADESAKLAAGLELPEAARAPFVKMVEQLHAAFVAIDASLLEINPLVLLASGELAALDAKVNLDENALFRHKELLELKDEDEEDQSEARAAKFGLSYIALDGDIGCMVNGAGLAMATMDAIKLKGGSPANFLDVGGGATKENVTEAFRIMLENPSLKAILVNIFGGIMRCDVIAEGVVAAAKEIEMKVPLVVRLEGTNVGKGKEILAQSGLEITSADDMDDAATKAVAAAS